MLWLPKKYSWKTKNKTNSGQALIIVLLTLSVVLAVVLSSVSRSVTDVSVSTSEQDSLRAFSAAEAGVEEALFTGGAVSLTTLPGGATYQAPLVAADAGNGFSYPADLLSGEVATFWFVSHASDSSLTCATGTTCYNHENIDIYWGDVNSIETPGIVFTVYSDVSVPSAVASPNNFSGVKVSRFAYDVAPTTVTNNFNSADVDTGSYSIGTRLFKYRIDNLVFNSSVLGCNQNTRGCLLFMRAKLLNNFTPQPVGIAVQAGRTLPPQGVKIESLGKAGDVSRKVSVFQAYPVPYSLFDSAVFSAGGLSK